VSAPGPAGAKGDLRSRLQAARAGVPAEARAAAGDALAVTAVELASDLVPSTGVVACYLSLGSEPPTSPLLVALYNRGVQLLVPVLRADADLDWTSYLPGQPLRPGLRGTVEPVTTTVLGLGGAALILVPALAVDEGGHRLGRGGGSYDRALCLRRPGAAVFGVLYDDEWLRELPSEPHDVRVDGAITPSGIRRAS
jgi:5-formyltetrahydrofolate cyclo-ligase